MPPGTLPFCSLPAQLLKFFNVTVLRGEKNICLAISEAFAGSDVAGMKTTAKKSADGKHYIVNGTKKWITVSCRRWRCEPPLTRMTVSPRTAPLPTTSVRPS